MNPRPFDTCVPPNLLGQVVSAGTDRSCLPPCRPIIFVGNHQTLALDTGLMLDGLVTQADILPRGLAHPAVFQVSTELFAPSSQLPSRL